MINDQCSMINVQNIHISHLELSQKDCEQMHIVIEMLAFQKYICVDETTSIFLLTSLSLSVRYRPSIEFNGRRRQQQQQRHSEFKGIRFLQSLWELVFFMQLQSRV